MADAHVRFHTQWLGMVQPSEGLVFSVPVLAEAQCMERQAAAMRAQLAGQLDDAGRIAHLGVFFETMLELAVGDDLEAPPDDLSLYVSEGRQTLRPTFGLKAIEPREVADDVAPAVRAGAPYVALVWDLPPGLALDQPETETGEWRYPPGAKFDRLLRASRVPIGLLTNREVIRLVYAPHGQSSGWIDFRLADMLDAGGGPILDAFVVLLRAERWFSVAEAVSLPGLLAASRTRQANVTNELADQVFAALNDLLAGFDRANDRDPRRPLDAALEDGDVYGGLLAVLLRLVFLLYSEEHGLLPVDHPLYAQHLSVLALYDQLLDDAGAHPDEMDRRYGAWPRLLAAFRAVYYGVDWQPRGESDAVHLEMPARSGDLFNPDRYPWLEGRAAGAASLDPVQNAQVRTPPLDDGTVLAILEKLIVVEGQRLSYKALDVEQIGSVYERLMGYRVERVTAPAVRLHLDKAKVWITGVQVMAQPKNRRKAWLQDTVGLKRAAAGRLAKALAPAADNDTALAILVEHAGVKKPLRAAPGRLVLQPGRERRRTSSHYTPRSLSAPIVARTLEPLIKCIGEAPTAEQILELKICDPAMGSGAFLVEACRYLSEQVVAAWTRSGEDQRLAARVPDLAVHARRLVAQRCLYGVDKNPFAVELARMSLWLVTLARELPFTFVDHALRHGDSLVGLSLDQIGGFHWTPKKQVSLFTEAIRSTLDDTVEMRQQILNLADSPDTAEKARLLDEAEYFTQTARIIADACVGAFFAEAKKGAREKERKRRLALVEAWLRDEDGEAEAEVRRLAAQVRAEVAPFHWMLEFPEVFYAERPDPLAGGAPGVAWMDGFVGNPPFAGKNAISDANPDHYLDWFYTLLPEVKGRANTDLCAYFFRRIRALLGPHGTLGLIATNTIAQGDSRLVGLKPILLEDAAIYDATTDFVWPGAAAVTASILTIAVGETVPHGRPFRLNGQPSRAINSRLQPRLERDEPQPLRANRGKAYMGGKLVGVGLAVSPEEYAALVESDGRNAEILRPYLGGQEVNSHPKCSFRRYVVDFTDKTLDEARAWPELLEIAERLVKPARMKDKRGTYKTYWWRPGESGRALYDALRGRRRCLVASRVSKHLMVAFQSPEIFFAESLYVFAFESTAAFAVLQSRVHEPWARLLSSSFGGSLRYIATKCFDTFPFPADMTDPALEAAGEALYTARAAYMIEHDQGLTATYNQLKDPACRDPQIERLRRLHEAMDRAVIAAYGWFEVDAEGQPMRDAEGEPIPLRVPAYGTAEPAEQQAFEDEVIDRLFVLNAERAEEEAAAARAGAGAGSKRSKKTKSKKKAAGDGQMELL